MPSMTCGGGAGGLLGGGSKGSQPLKDNEPKPKTGIAEEQGSCSPPCLPTTAIGVTPVTTKSTMPVVTPAVPVPWWTIVTAPAVSRGSHHEGTVSRVNRVWRSNHDRRGPVDWSRSHDDGGRTWCRRIHHRRCRCANHSGRINDRQADGNTHAPTRPSRIGDRKS